MTNENNQQCSRCRHLNPAEALICDLCSSGLAKEGMMLTCHPSSALETIDVEKTLPPQQSLTTENTLSLGATIAPKHDTSDKNSSSIENDSMAHFKITKVLGQGGMGAVYKAQDLTLHRFVALKMFRSDLSATSGNGLQLLDEARMACKLNHPNIVTIYDISRSQNSNFIAMEWVDGKPLDELIPDNGLTVKTALEYACQIIDGLVCAHQNGIIHRDIKPQNIMVNKENRIKILDFGIADLLRQPSKSSTEKQSKDSPVDDGNITRMSGVVGTPQYMAPEQALGLAVDQRADIYAFGVVLYEMLTGQRPFKGKNLKQLEEALSKGDYPPLNQLQPEMPDELIALVDKMLVTDVSLRWQTSEELAEVIHELYDQLTERKNWWQRRHWLSKVAVVLPFILMLGWSLNEIIFPPTTQELIERQLVGASKIAVLPFENISGDPLLQIFNDGLVTTLSSDLSKAGLEQGDGTTWVIPSSEIRRMKEPTVKSVSDKFGVDLLLTGSVQHMGSTRLLVLNLVNAKDGRQLKTTEMNIDADQLFQGQQDVRKQVLALLGWDISDDLAKQFGAERPQFDGAYKEYVEGRAHLYRYDLDGNLEKALIAFENAIKMDSKYEGAYESLAEVQFRIFRRNKNVDWLDKMTSTVVQLEKLNPDNKKINFLLAEIDMQYGKYKQAINFYENSIKQNPQHTESKIGLARAFTKIGKQEEAEEIYKSAAEKSPNNWRVVSFIGIFYYQIGNYQESINQFNKLISMSPNNDYGYRNAAGVLYILGNIDAAIDYTKQAIKIRPSEFAYSNLGTMLFYIKKYQESVKVYEKAVELNDVDYVNWGNLGDAYKLTDNIASEGAYSKAIELAQKEIELNPNDSTAKADIAYYLANLRQTQQALFFAKQIGEENQGTENFVVATAYDLMNLPEQTTKHLKIAINKNYPLEEILNTPLLPNSRQTRYFKSLKKIEQQKTID